MASEKILGSKKEYVEELRKKIADAAAGVVVNYQGLSVVDDTKMRAELREAGVEYSVVKNTMLRLAVKDTAIESLGENLSGFTAIAVAKEDPMAPARIINKYAEKSKSNFALKSGFMEGRVMGEKEVVAIANLPSRDGLLSMLLSALQGNLRGLAVALNAVAEKKQNEVA